MNPSGHENGRRMEEDGVKKKKKEAEQWYENGKYDGWKERNLQADDLFFLSFLTSFR